MKLRPFSIEDAPVILSWIKDKTDFRKWSADRYSSYPPKPEDMLAQYANDNIFPFTAINDAGKVIGHLILRYSDSSKTVIRLGFIIIDNQLRGKGYGKQMLELAIQKAQRDYKVQKITLGVFDNNPSAIRCYESVGFTVTGTDTYLIDGERWMGKEMEIHILFMLQQSVDAYDFFTKQMEECDKQIEALLAAYQARLDSDANALIRHKRKKIARSTNAPEIDIEKYAFAIWGVNVFDIPGLKDLAVMQLIGELGHDFIEKFENAEKFLSISISA